MSQQISLFGLFLIFLFFLYSRVRKSSQIFRKFCTSLRRDVFLLFLYLRITVDVFSYKFRNLSIADCLDRLVKRTPNKPLIYFEDEEWTAKELQTLSLQVAHFFNSHGAKNGDTFGLLMENSPEFISIWIGLSRLGCTTAFINSNLRVQQLYHSVSSVKCKDSTNDLKSPQIFEFCRNESKPFIKISANSENIQVNLSDTKFITDLFTDFQKTSLGYDDPLAYIFTSGTTGFPKAAIVKTHRIITAACSLYYFCGLSASSDKIYTTLPLYHLSAAAVTGGLPFLYGIPVIIKKKFSGSEFWNDCVKYDATVGHYIGEICRYILVQPPCAADRNHKLRLMFGNGVRPFVWEAFKSRYGINSFIEFYGSTEGNCFLVNPFGKVGAVGYIPNWLSCLAGRKIIRLMDTSGCILRNGRFAVECLPGEVGELVAEIKPNQPMRGFDGYTDSVASETKILRNVFRKGDKYFRSGDLLHKDKDGFFYFHDRIGDTFRCKGENISATEIESVLYPLCGLNDVMVFGVKIPNVEGKVTMAVVGQDKGKLDLGSFVTEVKASLPKYAYPIFLRLTTFAEITGTFKLKKEEYKKAGFDLKLTQDDIFFLKDNKYIRLDESLYSHLMNGQIRI